MLALQAGKRRLVQKDLLGGDLDRRLFGAEGGSLEGWNVKNDRDFGTAAAQDSSRSAETCLPF